MSKEPYLTATECAKRLGMKWPWDIYKLKLQSHMMRKKKYCQGVHIVKHFKLSEVKAALEERRRVIAQNVTAMLKIRRRYGRGAWETLSADQFPSLPEHASMKTISEIEQHLNNGLLCEQAEAAYPRMGMHSHAIYKVTPIYKKP